jgi:NADPH:quinone reductase-like Zn-dependent oxidoreductase
MRALVTTGGGTVEFAEVPEPSPASSELVVQVSATSVGRGDFHTMGLTPPGTPLGLDVVGVVAEPAADGSGPTRGTLVMGYKGTAGTWAERAAVDTSLVIPIPDGLGDDVAAALPNSGLAALAGLEAGGFLLGSRVLVTGATGGVGMLAVQLANMAGANVTAAVSSPARARNLGAFEWLDTAVLDEISGPFDLIVDLVGGDVLSRAMTLVAEDGVVATLAQSAHGTATIPVFWFAAHPGARLVSVYNTKGQREAGRGVRRLGMLASLAQAGQLDPHVAEVTSWEKAADLLAALGRRELTGKAVMRIS